ncbi:hypothetical protein MTR67_052987 [Solanum verrucosum]|uniref:HTH myb-type domain-containing protein n=1 Tax=Solanum verrucosum TaxID=315347 RepID=A0AAF0V770_SOLVR|nr:hypothetical protein MTR67_052987 [Solanum verrucosum]
MPINTKEQRKDTNEVETNVISNGEYSLGRKRGRQNTKEINEGERKINASNVTVTRKDCIEWTINLHGKFVEATQQLGEKSCLPKNIVKEMNVSGLTKNQVSSHLQQQQQLCRPQLQAQPHYLNPFLSSQNNVDGRIQNNGPLFGSQGPIIRSTNYKPCLEYNSCDHHNYNMDVNAAHVPTYSSSPMAFNTNIGDATVNRLGTINTNFPQDVREQNMSSPSNIVTASNAVDIEGNDSNEKEDCDLYFNYNDYLKCFNNEEDKEDK